MTMMGFLLFPLSSPISAFTVGFSNYYHCQFHETIVRIVSVVDGLVGVCLFAIILVPSLGMNGLWFAQIAGCLLSALVLYSFAIIYNKKIPFTMEAMMCYPKDFGVPDENRIDISVHNLDEVINISRKVWDFCEKHNIDHKRMNCASLCVEELAGNIIRHGFSDKKDRHLDIRVSYIGENIVIGFKDNCKSFDPTEAAKLFNPEDVTHNIGLRIATKISKSMTYQNTFGLNILRIAI